MLASRKFSLVSPGGDTLVATVHGSGPTLMLLHGFPLDGTMWNGQAETLAAAGWQVVVPDLRGFGESKMAGDSFTIADLAADVELLREHLIGDQPVTLVGLSMGGYIALEYWRRWEANLERLVLSNTKPTADAPAGRAGRLEMAERALSLSTWEAVEPMLPKLLGERTRMASQETSEFVATMMARVPPQTVAAAQRAMADRREFSPELARVKVPTLVIAGEQDPIAPVAEGEQWSSQIPGARFEVIGESGHLPPIEATEQFNRVLLQFLNAGR